MDLPFTFGSFALAAATVAIGYCVFAITGFGAALMTVPVLSHVLPLPFVLPLSVLLDVSAAVVMGVRFRKEAEVQELKLMVPSSLAGAIAGVSLLVSLPRDAALTCLAVFVLAYGIYSLFQGTKLRQVPRAWAPVAGFVGGAMGTLFGIGAPPYVMYLSRRIPDKAAMRATLSSMVLASTAIRLTVFAFAGLMLADRLLAFALLLPFALVGLWAGHRVHVGLRREHVLAAIGILLIGSGVSLLVRVFAR
jgi:uncharacterized membrane protein YfcA